MPYPLPPGAVTECEEALIAGHSILEAATISGVSPSTAGRIRGELQRDGRIGPARRGPPKGVKRSNAVTCAAETTEPWSERPHLRRRPDDPLPVAQSNFLAPISLAQLMGRR